MNFVLFFEEFSIEHSKQLPFLSNYVKNRMNNSILDVSKLEELYYIKRIPMVQRFLLIILTIIIINMCLVE